MTEKTWEQRARELLKSIEWLRGIESGFACCPVCGHREHQKHRQACALSALLSEPEPEMSEEEFRELLDGEYCRFYEEGKVTLDGSFTAPQLRAILRRMER